MLEIKLPHGLYRILANLREDEFNRFLHERLEEYRKYLEWNDREALLKTKEEIEKKVARMREELRELQDFCDMAERDQKLLLQFTEQVDEENEVLSMSMEMGGENGDSDKIGSS